MKRIPLLAAGIAAVTIALAPTAAANAATLHTAADGRFTVSVTGSGHGNIEYIAITDPAKASGLKSHVSSGVKLPWHKSFSAKSELVEVVASSPTGKKISCSITDASGHVISTGSGRGAHGVAVCIATAKNLVGFNS